MYRTGDVKLFECNWCHQVRNETEIGCINLTPSRVDKYFYCLDSQQCCEMVEEQAMEEKENSTNLMKIYYGTNN